MLQVRSLSLALSLFPWLALIRNVHPMGSVQCYSYEIFSGWPRDTQPSFRALNDPIHLTCVYESRKRDLNNVSHFLFINIKYKYIFLHPHYSQFPIAYCLLPMNSYFQEKNYLPKPLELSIVGYALNL